MDRARDYLGSAPLIDCHVHVVDPQRFPYAAGPGYKPRSHETGPREALGAVLEGHGVRHALLVQPSCYGFDNAAMIDAMAGAPGRYKAIAVVGLNAADHELEDLAAAGVIGVRFNLSIFEPDALARPESERFLQRLKELGWFAQIYAEDVQWAAAAALLRRTGVRVLVDHLGVGAIAAGITQPGFQQVLKLGREGCAIVKLSVPLGNAQTPKISADLRPFVDALLENFGVERCVWGSDWPFLGATTPPAYADVADLLQQWVPGQGDREQILWRNPVRLFAFGE